LIFPQEYWELVQRMTVHLDSLSAILLAVSFGVFLLAAFEYGAACARRSSRRNRLENHDALIARSRKKR